MLRGSSSSVKVFYPPYKREEMLSLLKERLLALSSVLPLQQAVLFGSWAKGRATAFSDIDILLIYKDPPQEDAYQLARYFLKLKGLEPHVYSGKEAESIKAILDRMTQGGIVLFSHDTASTELQT